MTDNVAIRVQGLSKKYVIGHQAEREHYTTLRDVIARKMKSLARPAADFVRKRAAVAGGESEEFWALKNVNFEVKRGEVVGIIGRNGAGKSTLLKILSRITEPSGGRVEIKGRVASLLEVGTGFHPELTGRENIYLNGAILGMKRAEIRRKFDEIVAFAEVERFLDTPVKRYSSGMYVRLAFAVAAHVEPEILIVDEVLAVGDAGFQRKCLGKMGDVATEGRTVLFVSHNMGAVRTLTERCIYLENGQVALDCETNDVIEAYLTKSLYNKASSKDGLDFYRRSKNSDSPATIKSIRLRGENNSETIPALQIGSRIIIEVTIHTTTALQGAYVNIMISSTRGDLVTVVLSLDHNFKLFVEPGCHMVTACISDLSLSPGEYAVDVGIGSSTTALAFDVIMNLPLFEVVNNGQISHWLERPWGPVHCQVVTWESRPL